MQNMKVFAGATMVVAIASTLLTPPARADQKMVTITTITSPQMDAMMKKMSPEQQAQMAQSGMAGSINSVFYISGKHIKAQMPRVTYLIDNNVQKVVILNPATHTYFTYPYKQSDPDDDFLKTAKITIADLGETKPILGHQAHHYSISMSMPEGTASMSTTGDVWATEDLPQPDFGGALGGPAEVMSDQLKRIKGLPLATTMTIVTGPGNGVIVKSVVTTLSTDMIPASAFDIPSDYMVAKSNLEPPKPVSNDKK